MPYPTFLLTVRRERSQKVTISIKKIKNCLFFMFSIFFPDFTAYSYLSFKNTYLYLFWFFPKWHQLCTNATVISEKCKFLVRASGAGVLVWNLHPHETRPSEQNKVGHGHEKFNLASPHANNGHKSGALGNCSFSLKIQQKVFVSSNLQKKRIESCWIP